MDAPGLPDGANDYDTADGLAWPDVNRGFDGAKIHNVRLRMQEARPRKRSRPKLRVVVDARPNARAIVAPSLYEVLCEERSEEPTPVALADGCCHASF